MIKRYKVTQTFVPKDPLSIFSNPKARTQSDIPVHKNNISKMYDIKRIKLSLLIIKIYLKYLKGTSTSTKR